MTIYTTNEHKGYGNKSYYYNEYRTEGNLVVKYRVHRQKSFDGKENYWSREEKKLASWTLDDPNMPEWLHKHLS